MTENQIRPGETHPVSGNTLTRYLAFSVAMDNYEPSPRTVDRHILAEWRDTDGDVTYVIEPGWQDVKDWNRAVYLLDDGRTVTAWYVAGWHPKRGTVTLKPFPVNVNPDGTPRLRADRPEPVDYSTWMLGPRRAYHLKIREA